MPAASRNSNCSARVPVTYYWWASSSDSQSEHVAATVDALFKAVSGPGRRWNPWASTLVRTEFRRRIEKATAGALEPVDEVKALGDGRTSLFEIRWSDVAVATVTDDGEVRHDRVEVRLIHAEPVELGLSAIGLHAHEKTIYPGDNDATHAAQNEQIGLATEIYHRGVAPTLRDRGPLRS